MRERFQPRRRVLLLVSVATLTFVAPVFCSGADVAAAPAQNKAKPSSPVRVATVELVEHQLKKKPHSSRYQLALSRDGRLSRVSSDDGVTRTTITVRQIDREQSAPLVQVDVMKWLAPLQQSR